MSIAAEIPFARLPGSDLPAFDFNGVAVPAGYIKEEARKLGLDAPKSSDEVWGFINAISAYIAYVNPDGTVVRRDGTEVPATGGYSQSATRRNLTPAASRVVKQAFDYASQEGAEQMDIAHLRRAIRDFS